MENVVYKTVAGLRKGCETKIELLKSKMNEDSRLLKYDSAIEEFEQEFQKIRQDLETSKLLGEYRNLNRRIAAVEDEMVNEYLSFGHYHIIVDKKVYRFICRLMKRLKCSDAWRGKKGPVEGFKIIESEALKVKIFLLLLIRRQEKEKKPFNSNVIVAYLIKRLIRKEAFWDSKPENKELLRKEVPEFDDLIIEDAMERASQNVKDIFISEIDYLARQISEEEILLFKQASAIATAIEFEQLKPYIIAEDIPSSQERVEKELEKYDKEKLHCNKKMMNLFRRISWSRFTPRWEGYATLLNCDLLSHMYQTAVFVWLMAIETGEFEKAGYYFSIGMFHDDPEMWTDDVPSPCKDRIITDRCVTLREICDVLEVKAFAKYFYPCLSKETADYYLKNVDLNNVPEKDHALVKKADYLSADFECFLNIYMGSHEKEWADVIVNDFKNIPRTVESHKLLEHFVEQMEKKFMEI